MPVTLFCLIAAGLYWIGLAVGAALAVKVIFGWLGGGGVGLVIMGVRG
jgi:hypothetical protein